MTSLSTNWLRACLLPPTVASIVVLTGCQEQSMDPPVEEVAVVPAATLFTALSPQATGIDHVNRLNENEQWNILTYEYLYNGGGVAIGDIDGDGLQDIYLISNMGADKLYRNLGGFRFADISVQAGIGQEGGYRTGVTMADINGDGRLDIHVCRSAANEPEFRTNIAYINNGDLTFTDRAQELGIADGSYSTQAYFFDMDLDGDLDLFLLNHPRNMHEANAIPYFINEEGKKRLYVSKDLTYFSDRIYRNLGERFEDVTNSSGILNEAFGLSAAVGHFNEDQYPDIYVCNDYSRADQLMLSQDGRTYRNAFDEQFMHCAATTMGSDLADINNDGCADLITLDMVARDRLRYQTLAMAQNYDKYRMTIDVGISPQYSVNTVQVSNCNGTFSDASFMTGMAYTDWSWSALIADLDNDGRKDVHITNGYIRDVTNNDYMRYAYDSLKKAYNRGEIRAFDWLNAIPSAKLPSFLFRNEGGMRFTDVSREWNSGPAAFSNGAAYGDLDNDGFLDLVVNNINDPALVLRNTGGDIQDNRSIRFTLDAGPRRTAMLSTIRIRTPDGVEQVQQLQPTRGFLSSSEHVLHFGLGDNDHVTEARVTWPDGTSEAIPTPVTGQVNHVVRSAAAKRSPSPHPPPAPFVDLSTKLPARMAHKENEYIDFKREPLLHHKLSEDGPGVAVGDVDLDGTDDVYVGGARGSAGRLFRQTGNGKFVEKEQSAFSRDTTFEDVAALFFDATGDGAPDLYVASGGNEAPDGDPSYQDRLYLNDGRGGFTLAENALPPQRSSSSCVEAADIDNDGDLDLFIGGRSVPGRYPMASRSMLLRNDGGKFTDVTSTMAQDLEHVGMVTDARFADLDGDGPPELVIVGEWMPITVFKVRDGQYRNVTDELGLGETHGWWCSVDIGDLDEDGFPEIVAGNLGLNSFFKASPEEPITMHYKDFDRNGTIDPILCMYWDGGVYPVHMRDRVLDQMVMLKKRFTRYQRYATSTLKDLFTEKELEGQLVLKANTLAHTLFHNRNGSQFESTPLPDRAQMSMARAMTMQDADGDGHLDVLVAGNFFGTDVQFGRYDACIGTFLRNDGTGSLEFVEPALSGLVARGNVRSLHHIRSSGMACLLVARTNEAFGLIGMRNTVP